MSRESSLINEDSKLADGPGEMVSSASNNYLDGACEMSSRVIVELQEVAEDKACTEEENEDQFVEVRNRKLTEKGRSYQTEIKIKSFKYMKSTFTGTMRKTLLLRRLKFCGINLRMRTMKSEKLLKATIWRLSGTSGSKFVVRGLILKRM